MVEIFAQALKQLSEARLRSTFAASAERRSDNRELFVAGLLAAGKLVGWEPALLELAPVVGATLADVFEGDRLAELELPAAFWAWWAPLQAAALALAHWLAETGTAQHRGWPTTRNQTTYPDKNTNPVARHIVRC